MEEFGKMTEALIAGRIEEVVKLVQEALDGGAEPSQIMDHGLFPGMDVVGQHMKTGEMFIPEVLRSAKAMQEAMNTLKPFLSEGDSAGRGTMIIGTVQGDLHDIGKNLVAMLIEGAGFNVIDLGVDIRPDTFVAAVKEHKASILGMSALLTTTVTKMEDTIKAIEAAGLRDHLKILIGGAPVTPEMAQKIGADRYASNAGAAAEAAKELTAA